VTDEHATYPIVLVEWVDSCGLPTGWVDVVDLVPEVSTCRTAGFLLRDDGDLLCIAGSVDEAGEAREIMVIPRVAVRSVKSLCGV